jgi:hypothetical protein
VVAHTQQATGGTDLVKRPTLLDQIAEGIEFDDERAYWEAGAQAAEMWGRAQVRERESNIAEQKLSDGAGDSRQPAEPGVVNAVQQMASLQAATPWMHQGEQEGPWPRPTMSNAPDEWFAPILRGRKSQPEEDGNAGHTSAVVAPTQQATGESASSREPGDGVQRVTPSRMLSDAIEAIEQVRIDSESIERCDRWGRSG